MAKYFAIARLRRRPVLKSLDVMRLDVPACAILSAVIFNALIIIAWYRWP
ncbi:MAG: hypothetical protein U0790_06835 [Isosphaeraceae bacterium]